MKNIIEEKMFKSIKPLQKKSRNFYYLCKYIILAKYRRFFLRSYSQYGEDLMLDKLLNYKENGFYIDIGANDPIILNNTKKFYDKGWTGINIEPHLGCFKRIKFLRKKDINLNLGISDKKGKLTFYLMNASTLSTFNKEEMQDNVKAGFKLIKTVKIPVLTLGDIFEKYVGDRKIDFLSLDVEGHDYEVLKGNNWNKYRPNLIVIEINHDSRLLNFLKNQRYKEVYRNNCNAILKDDLNSSYQ